MCFSLFVTFRIFSAAPLIPCHKLSALRRAASLCWFLILAKVTSARTPWTDFTAAFPRVLTTKGRGAGNDTGGVAWSLRVFSEFRGLWVWERDEKRVWVEAWTSLCTWDVVRGERGGGDKPLLGKRSPELGFRISHKYLCDPGWNLSLPWISASCSVQGEGLETLAFVT